MRVPPAVPLVVLVGLLITAIALGITGFHRSAPALPPAATARTVSAPPPGPVMWSTGLDYTPQQLVAAVPALRRTSAGNPTSAPSDPTRPGLDPLAALRNPDSLAACLTGVSGSSSSAALALDYARFAGESALVIVLPGRGAADRLDVYVVGASCGAADSDLRYFTRLQ